MSGDDTNSLTLTVVQLVERLAQSLEHRDIYYGGELCEGVYGALKAAAMQADDMSSLTHRVRVALQRFTTVAIVDAKRALSSDGRLEFDDLIDLMGKMILRAKGIILEETRLHPEDLTQLLKDERGRVLVCIFAVHCLSETHLQRLRGLGLTQMDHRVLFCGSNEYLHRISVENSASTDTAGQRELAKDGTTGVIDSARHALLVGQRPPEREFIRRTLVAQDFHVETAVEYEAALVYLAKTIPHLIVIDLMLPRESGFELCEYIRNDERHRFVPVLVTSDRSSPEYMAHAEDVGANAFLRKPFARDKLIKYIVALLEDGRGVNHGSVRRLRRTQKT